MRIDLRRWLFDLFPPTNTKRGALVLITEEFLWVPGVFGDSRSSCLVHEGIAEARERDRFRREDYGPDRNLDADINPNRRVYEHDFAHSLMRVRAHDSSSFRCVREINHTWLAMAKKKNARKSADLISNSTGYRSHLFHALFLFPMSSSSRFPNGEPEPIGDEAGAKDAGRNKSRATIFVSKWELRFRRVSYRAAFYQTPLSSSRGRVARFILLKRIGKNLSDWIGRSGISPTTSECSLVSSENTHDLLFRLVPHWFWPAEARFHCKICDTHDTWCQIQLSTLATMEFTASMCLRRAMTLSVLAKCINNGNNCCY